MASKDRTSKITACDTENGGTMEHACPSSETAMKPLKVKFAYKLVNFICAVVALSWFFEGWRKVNESISALHVFILLAGTLATVLFLGIHAYWVYVEEKHKGTLKKRIGLFEKIYLASQSKSKTEVIVNENREI